MAGPTPHTSLGPWFILSWVSEATSSSLKSFSLSSASVQPTINYLARVIRIQAMGQDLEDAKVVIRKSQVREEIVRELAMENDLRPTEIFDRISERVETTKENFYQNLRALTGTVVTKTEGSRRMTLYSLTETGEAVAESLGLTKTEQEQLRSFAFQSSLSPEEIAEILEEVKERMEE